MTDFPERLDILFETRRPTIHARLELSGVCIHWAVHRLVLLIIVDNPVVTGDPVQMDIVLERLISAVSHENRLVSAFRVWLLAQGECSVAGVVVRPYQVAIVEGWRERRLWPVRVQEVERVIEELSSRVVFVV